MKVLTATIAVVAVLGLLAYTNPNMAMYEQYLRNTMIQQSRQEGGASAAGSGVAACDAQETEIAAVQKRLAEARNRPNAMFQAVTTAAKRLRGISYDLEDLAEGVQPSAPGNVAAPPPE